MSNSSDIHLPIIKIVEAYYEGWRTRSFDAVPFHADFTFHGPIDTFYNAADFVNKCINVSQALNVDIAIRQIISDATRVFIIYDFITNSRAGIIRTAEWIRFKDGQINRIEVFFDATELRKILLLPPIF